MRTRFVYALAFTIACISVYHVHQVQTMAQARKHALQATHAVAEAIQNGRQAVEVRVLIQAKKGG